MSTATITPVRRARVAAAVVYPAGMYADRASVGLVDATVSGRGRVERAICDSPTRIIELPDGHTLDDVTAALDALGGCGSVHIVPELDRSEGGDVVGDGVLYTLHREPRF